MCGKICTEVQRPAVSVISEGPEEIWSQITTKGGPCPISRIWGMTLYSLPSASTLALSVHLAQPLLRPPRPPGKRQTPTPSLCMHATRASLLPRAGYPLTVLPEGRGSDLLQNVIRQGNGAPLQISGEITEGPGCQRL